MVISIVSHSTTTVILLHFAAVVILLDDAEQVDVGVVQGEVQCNVP